MLDSMPPGEAKWQSAREDRLGPLHPRSHRPRLFLLLLLGLLSLPAFGAPTDVTQWRSGLIELNQGWMEHEGDDPAWARPDDNDSSWQTVDLDDLGPATVGSRWFRRHVKFGPDHPNVTLLLSGADGTYELYVNGRLVSGPRLRSSLAVARPVERVFSLHDDVGDFVIALRTRVPASYAAWHLPQFMSVTIGQPTAIGYERQALESQRLYGVAPSIAANLLLCLAGIGALAFYASQRLERDYLLLGLYLFFLGISGSLAALQLSGALPLSANFLIADPLLYLAAIAQIEFTFSFARHRVGRALRVYEIALLAPLVLAVFTWVGRFPSNAYVLVEAAVTAPVGLLLSILLFIWYRRGNREAGWLILPSLAPAVSNALFDLGTASILLGWGHFDFLIDSIQIGPIPLQTVDLGSLIFLLSVGVVMFFRFTHVSREQARIAAELEAAREIQRRLVPASVPNLPNCKIEAAYLPAQEVGGDFYQVIPLEDCSTLVVIGDVSGKGLKAAMTGALAIGALGTLAAEGLDLARLLSRLNREIVRTQDSGFITCLCVRISDRGTVRLANAGHLPPYLNGEEIAVETGLPLGVIEDASYIESGLETKPGDTLTLLSDGVVEARNSAGELFGFERTQAISAQSAADIGLSAQLFGQEDDITVVTLTFGGSPGQ
jgi:hypothetical protein